MDLDPIAKAKIRKLLRNIQISLDLNFRRDSILPKVIIPATSQSQIISTSTDEILNVDEFSQVNEEEDEEIEIVVGTEFEENTVEAVVNDELLRVDEKSGDNVAVQRENSVEEVDDVAIDEGDEGVGEVIDEGADEVFKEADRKIKIAMSAPENGQRERKIEKEKEELLAALPTIPDAKIQATLFATFDLGHSFLDLNKMGHKFFIQPKPILSLQANFQLTLNSRLRNTLELVKPKSIFSNLLSISILQSVYPHINKSQNSIGFNVGEMAQLNSFPSNSKLFPLDPSIPIPSKPNFTFNFYDPFLVDPIKKNEIFSIYFSDFNFKKWARWKQLPWSLLFSPSSWPITLVPLWIWEEVRRAFSIGVFFSSAGPNSRSSSFFLVW